MISMFHFCAAHILVYRRHAHPRQLGIRSLLWTLDRGGMLL
jgi:hypothetical protein